MNEKSQKNPVDGYTYKITPISSANFPRELNLI